MDPVTAIAGAIDSVAGAVGSVFSEVGTWFTTGQEQQQFDIDQAAIDAQILISNNQVAIASMDETFTDDEQQQLLLYAIIAIVLIIVIAISVMIIKK